MKKLLLLLLLSLGLIGNSYAHILHCSLEEAKSRGVERCYLEHDGNDSNHWECNEGYVKNYLETGCIKKGTEYGNLMSRKLNNEILSSYDKKDFGGVEETLETYWNVCFEYTLKKSIQSWQNFWAQHNAQNDELLRLAVEAQEALIEVGNRCHLSEDESCKKEIKEARFNAEDAMRKYQAARSTIVDPDDPRRYASRRCANWHSDIKKTLGLDYSLWREGDGYTQWFKEREKARAELEVLYLVWLDNVESRVKTFWDYKDADDDWYCDVSVKQDINGNVEEVKIERCNPKNESARPFWLSIKDAIFKASPLPALPDKKLFRRIIRFQFNVNY